MRPLVPGGELEGRPRSLGPARCLCTLVAGQWVKQTPLLFSWEDLPLPPGVWLEGRGRACRAPGPSWASVVGARAETHLLASSVASGPGLGQGRFFCDCSKGKRLYNSHSDKGNLFPVSRQMGRNESTDMTVNAQHSEAKDS